MSGLRVLSLFAGGGGFDIGLDRAGGFAPAAFCEINDYCRRLLSLRWPGVPIHEDVRTLCGRDVGPVDVICGGFPCQDISHAGSRAGIDGDRSGLWGEYARLIGELRPGWVLVENVSALLVRGIDRVLGDLAALGYDAWWDCVRASTIGYPHARDRLWLVAYPAALRRDQGERAQAEWRRLVWARSLGRPSAWAQAANDDEIRSGFIRVDHGLPDHVERLGMLGNAIVPEFAELLGRAILTGERAA